MSVSTLSSRCRATESAKSWDCRAACVGVEGRLGRREVGGGNFLAQDEEVAKKGPSRRRKARTSNALANRWRKEALHDKGKHFQSQQHPGRRS